MDHGRVAFGLAATTVALKARTGQLRLQDQVDFALRALEFVPRDDIARLAVLDFLTHVRLDPAGAGARLQDFIGHWSTGALDPARVAQVLADVAKPKDTTETERRLQ